MNAMGKRRTSGSRSGTHVALALTLTAAAATVGAQPVHACSPVRCSPGEFTPYSDAEIPANAPALAWKLPVFWQDDTQTGSPLPQPEAELTRIDGAPEVVSITLQMAATDTVWILPEHLEANARYRLAMKAPTTGDDACVTPAVEFTTGKEAPLPRKLGTAVVSDTEQTDIQASTSSGQCFAPLPAATAKTSLAAAAEAKPWLSLLLFETWVDQKHWEPLWDGDKYIPAEGHDLVFKDCPDRMPKDGSSLDPLINHSGVNAGPHKLVIAAVLPGEGRLQTDETPFELLCDSQSPSSASDASVAEADSQDETDAGVGVDMNVDASTSTSSNAKHDEGDDGCSVTRPGGARRSPGSTLLMLGTLMFCLRRRRARVGAATPHDDRPRSR